MRKTRKEFIITSMNRWTIPLCRALGGVAVVWVFLGAMPVHAQVWVPLAGISATAALVTNTLCYTDGVDLVCNGAGGSVGSNGVTFTNISATALTVNGVDITGAGSSSDAITSGTTAVTANTTGYISLTTGGTTTGYFDTAGRLVVPGVSTTTYGVSSTTGYFSSNMGIGTIPAAGVELSVNGGTGTGEVLIKSGATNYDAMTSFVTSAGTKTGFVGYDESAGLVKLLNDSSGAFGTSTKGIVIDSSGNVGIGTIAPTTNLEVSGTVSATAITINGKSYTEICDEEVTLDQIHSSNISGGYEASASSEYTTSDQAWEAFDGVVSEAGRWGSLSGDIPGWLKYKFPSPHKVSKYTIYPRPGYTGVNQHAPTAFTFQGSNDNTNWTTLDTKSGVTFALSTPNTYTISNTTSYTYYRLYMTASTSTYLVISELELYGNRCRLVVEP